MQSMLHSISADSSDLQLSQQAKGRRLVSLSACSPAGCARGLTRSESSLHSVSPRMGEPFGRAVRTTFGCTCASQHPGGQALQQGFGSNQQS